MGFDKTASSGSSQSQIGLLCLVLLASCGQVASNKPVIVLVHGLAQGGYFFNYNQPELGAPDGVKGLFEDAGYEVFNPSLPYHSLSDAYKASDGPVTADDYASSLASVFTANDLRNASVVCHAEGGVWCQVLYSKVPERIARMVFLDAYVALPGNSLVSTIIESYKADPLAVTTLFDPAAYSYPIFYTRVLGRVRWRKHYVNTRFDDDAFVNATYELLVPEPNQPLYDALNVTGFVAADLPKAFVYETEDFVSGTGAELPDPGFWLTYARRLAALRNGGYEFRVYKGSGDHQGFLTDPVASARVILGAMQYLGG